MNLHGLESLVAISETHSFVEAARRVGVSQSAISMQMKALEDDLKVALFDRSVRPPVMTPTGVVITRIAREILAGTDEIRRSARAASALAGTLRIGAVQTATLALLPIGVSAIVHRHPGINITMVSGLSKDLIERLCNRELDAVIVTEPATLPEVVRSQPILRERLVLASGGQRSGARIADLADHPFVRFNRRVGVGAIVDDFLTQTGLAPNEFMELDSVDAILAMVERGLGVAIVPERSIGTSNRHRIVLAPIDDDRAWRSVSLITRVDSVKAQLVYVVADALKLAATRI